MSRVPLPIDRAALMLIRKYGDGCAIEAYRRSRCCACAGRDLEAREWQAVLHKVVQLHFARRPGPLN